MDSERRVAVIILDEIDKLVYKSGDDVLYHLSKINDDLDNDADGAVDEEIVDGKDDDNDGWIDEDSNGLYDLGG